MIQDAVAHKHGVRSSQKSERKNWLPAMIYGPKQPGSRNFSPPTPIRYVLPIQKRPRYWLRRTVKAYVAFIPSLFALA